MINKFKEAVKKLDEKSESVLGLLSSSIKSKAPVERLDLMSIHKLISDYNKLYLHIGSYMSDLEHQREKVWGDVYYEIKTGAHEMSVLNPSTHQEITKFTNTDDKITDLDFISSPICV